MFSPHSSRLVRSSFSLQTRGPDLVVAGIGFQRCLVQPQYFMRARAVGLPEFLEQEKPCSTCMNLTFRGGEASRTNLMSARPSRGTLREEPKMSASAVAVEVILM